MSIQKDSLADHGFPAPKFPQPQAVAEDSNSATPSTHSGYLVIVCRDRRSDKRPNSKNVEVRARNQRPCNPFRGAVDAQAKWCGAKCKHALQGSRAVPEFEEQ